MNELLKIFFKLLRGFVCHSDHSIDQNVRDLGCLWHSCAPKPLLWAGRAAVAVAHRCPAMLGFGLGDQGGSQCVDTKHSFPWVAVFRQGGFCHYRTHCKARHDLGHRYYFYYLDLQWCGRKRWEKRVVIPVQQNTGVPPVPPHTIPHKPLRSPSGNHVCAVLPPRS